MNRKIKNLIKKVLHYNVPFTPEELRKRGAKVGKNVKIYTNKIDLSHIWLLEIGDNVIIADCCILMHDGCTKRIVDYSWVLIFDLLFIV